MRIGLFGGTFNPIHNGHTKCALAVLKEFFLDKVLFIPVKIPVHKSIEGNITPGDRAAMINLAIKSYPFFELSTVEIDRIEDSYSITTVLDMKEKYPNDDLFFITGMDSINTYLSWKDYERLGKEIAFIILRRNVLKLDRNIHNFIDKLYISKNEEVCISSHDIRLAIKKRLNVNNMLHNDVRDYIREKGLYRN